MKYNKILQKTWLSVGDLRMKENILNDGRPHKKHSSKTQECKTEYTKGKYQYNEK